MSIFSFRDIVIDSRTGLNPRKNFKLGQGKNYYITSGGCTLTVNAHSYAVITAHKTGGVR